MIKTYEETKTRIVVETVTHRFKIDSERLEKLKERKDFTDRIKQMIQKQMKQIVKDGSGEFWESSQTEIFNELTKA